jgi:hypothetical protein
MIVLTTFVAISSVLYFLHSLPDEFSVCDYKDGIMYCCYEGEECVRADYCETKDECVFKTYDSTYEEVVECTTERMMSAEILRSERRQVPDIIIKSDISQHSCDCITNECQWVENEQ